MKKIVECVPNFSEGRDGKIIEAIARAIRDTEGCSLLDVDPGASTNRTVYTFVGDPRNVIEGALAAARVARNAIDMRRHAGEHPRFGALDVCPFIPVQNVTMDECVEIAKEVGRRLADEFNVPIFLYEEAAAHDYRRRLTDIRQGEYEELARRLTDPRWRPDFGPAAFDPGWGATATGARMFLIAYNVNILGTSNQAHRIALNLREAGRGEDAPGRLHAVKGMGWFIKEHNLAQVTVNLANYRVTPMHVLFEEVKKEAAELNVGVSGSEIVGLVPLEAILMAADYFIEKENLFILEEDQKVRLVIERLGLNSITPFIPKEKIIEYVVAEPLQEALAGMSLRNFIQEVSARTSAPGGGSVSAALAAMGIGLGSMAAKLTYGVRKFEDLDSTVRRIIPPLHELSRSLIPMIDADTNAFNEYMEGLRMPKDTPEQQTARNARMQEGLKTAARIPLKTMKMADQAWDAMSEAARCGNIACKSDMQVGARALETGIWGAYQNVCINAEGIQDQAFKKKTLKEAQTIAERAEKKCALVLKILANR